MELNNKCQHYPNLTIPAADYFYLQERINMKVVQDYNNTDQQPIYFNYEGKKDIYQGCLNLIKEQNGQQTRQKKNLLIGIISKGDSISLKINNTYKGCIYNDGFKLKCHKLKLIQMDIISSYQQYTKSQACHLLMFVDIPQYRFTLMILFILGLMNKWKSAQAIAHDFVNYVNYSNNPYQKLNDSYCQDFDDETPYSKQLVQEYNDLSNDPRQFSKYSIVSQNGINIMKGLNKVQFKQNTYILYSIFGKYRTFGGQIVFGLKPNFIELIKFLNFTLAQLLDSLQFLDRLFLKTVNSFIILDQIILYYIYRFFFNNQNIRNNLTF
ncbi:unnamed protein product [Paramecium sonneborni]|uniref:Transmembrane protein n=1 Tax=Paramecium sonneborni TaxID=65129 RepID=A0A8S1KLU4_9CILI|nr:unnamed protein product [Paramecium sonneborni]